MAGTTGLEPAASAVTARRELVLQQLTKTRGLPEYLQVAQGHTDCGLGCGLENPAREAPALFQQRRFSDGPDFWLSVFTEFLLFLLAEFRSRLLQNTRFPWRPERCFSGLLAFCISVPPATQLAVIMSFWLSLKADFFYPVFLSICLAGFTVIWLSV